MQSNANLLPIIFSPTRAHKKSFSASRHAFRHLDPLSLLTRKVHVYATDASAPSMDTSDSVGWFTVDMRDLAGQRLRDERWVKLQGANPAEVLISSTLTMARESDQVDTRLLPDNDSAVANNQQKVVVVAAPNEFTVSGAERARAESVTANSPKSPSYPPSAPGPRPPESSDNDISMDSFPRSANEQSFGEQMEAPGQPGAAAPAVVAEQEALLPPSTSKATTKSAAVMTLPEADAVSDLEALPVGPDASGPEARTFSLSISVKGAARLLRVTPPRVKIGSGFWFSYSVFGVVVQTDRFEHLADPGPGDRPVLEPMLDSFRLRATLPGLCQFFGEAPPLQVLWRLFETAAVFAFSVHD